MDCSTPGFPVHHQLPEPTQTHVHRVSDAIQPSHPLFFPPSGSFLMSQFFTSGGQSIGASASFLPMNIQGWFPLGLTSWISLQSKELSSILEASIFQHSAFFMVQISYLYMTTGKTILLTLQTLFSTVMSLLFNMLSRFVIAFLPRSKHLLISWLLSPSMVILKPKKIESVTVSTFSPSICYEVMRTDAMILVFWMLFLSQIFHSPFSPSSRGSFVHLML